MATRRLGRRQQNISLQHIASNLDPDSVRPLYRQIADRIADLVMTGALEQGCKLPASRDLAQSVGLSRNTIVLAYDQLIGQGVLRSDRGSGTYVEAKKLAQSPSRSPKPVSAAQESTARHVENENRYSQISGALHLDLPARPFRVNFPAIDAFPLRQWTSDTARILRRLTNDPNRLLLGEGNPSGFPALREAVAEHLRLARGVNATASNVLIFAGADQALDVVLRVIGGRQTSIWCEDPTYRGTIAALSAHCGEVHPIPVDADGFNVEYAIDRFPDARAAYVFPSNQFPMCVSMSAERRVKLLEWANRNGTWIIESDYDSELRYSGRPLPSLQSLDHTGCVIHIGTFSKIMFPSLRLGYAVIPDRLLDACIGARSVAGRYPLLDQMLACDFLTSGALARHVRRMRNLYAKRQQALLASLKEHLPPERITANPVAIGMQLVAWLHGEWDDRAVAQSCAELGLEISPMEAYRIERTLPPGLVLGFAAFDAEQLDEAVLLLKAVLDSTAGTR